MAVMGLLVIGGAGAGAYYYFMNPAVASPGAAEDGAAPAKTAKDKDHKAEPAVFVNLDPIILPMVDANGFNQVISLVVAIEVADPKDEEKVTNMMPRLQDAFIQQMYGEMNDKGYVKNGVIQVPKLKGRLNAIADEVLGEDLARDVLLQVIQQRPV